ncbi:MAG: hypothetical protein HFE63_06400 [Clostridiales bacterium]|nr:hypothetical protein [Clostridiales bacterium]
MKKALRILSLITALVLCLGVCTLATPFPVEVGKSLTESDTLDQIYTKIDELSALKSKLSLYCDITPDYENDETYIEMLNAINKLRNELISLGAQPSTNFLSILDDSISNTAEAHSWIGNDPPAGLTSFVDMFEDGFDMWGIKHDISTSYGDYTVYEMYIEDAPTTSNVSLRLKSNFEQTLFPSSKIPSASFSMPAVAEIAIDIAFDYLNLDTLATIYKHASRTVAVLSDLYNHVSSIQSIGGSGSSYNVTGSINTTMVFIFVKNASDPDTGSSWKQTHTTNKVTASEFHVVRTTDFGTSPNSDVYTSKNRSTTLMPQGFSLRLTDGITAFRYDNPRTSNIITKYKLVSDSNLISGVLFEITVPNAEERDDF